LGNVAIVSRGRLTVLVTALATLALAILAMAPLASAADGVGLGGPASDKDVTLFCFGVMAFFTTLVIVLSFIQGRLDSRKERARTEIERLRRP
jgi:hypothetical protein